MAFTLTVESVHSVLKRAQKGIFHRISPKHMQRYADEIEFHLHHADVKKHINERVERLLSIVFLARITYDELTA